MPEEIATLAAGLFAGAALYLSLVEHPAALEVGGGFAARFFPRMYRRAKVLQGGLAGVGTVAGLVAFARGFGALWLLGALLLGSAIPLTLLVLKPLNDRLTSGRLDPEAPETTALLRRWGRLHALRSAAGVLAFLAFVAARSDG